MDDETMDENEDDSDTSKLPLAQLFADGQLIPGLEIRLKFVRENAQPGKSNRRRWIWPAVFTFLAGKSEWIPYTKARELAKLYGPSVYRLNDELAKKQKQYAGECRSIPTSQYMGLWLRL